MIDFASLIVLSYQRPDFLQQSLTSLVDNTYGLVPYELIVVEDGSRDANWPFLMQLARSRDLSSIVLNAGDNLGVGVSMNRGFSVARGKWVAKLDADLEYRPGWLEAGTQILDQCPEVACLGFFDYRHYSPADERFNRLGEVEVGGEVVAYEVDDFVSSSMLIRRGDWLRYGLEEAGPLDQAPLRWRGFEEGSDAFAEDVEWKRRMQALGFKLAITAEQYHHNFGFGLGNSTVVVPGAAGPEVSKIAKQPLLFGGRPRSLK